MKDIYKRSFEALSVGAILTGAIVTLLCLVAFLFTAHKIVCVVGYCAYLATLVGFTTHISLPFRVRDNVTEMAFFVLLGLLFFALWKYAPNLLAIVSLACWSVFAEFVVRFSMKEGLVELKNGSAASKAGYWAVVVVLLIFFVTMPILASGFAGGYAAGIVLTVLPFAFSVIICNTVDDDQYAFGC